MFYSTILLAASAAFSGMASAQTSIDPNSVSSTDRLAWCRAETNSCPVLCGGDISVNNCSSTDLTYDCVCSNGLVPNMSEYEQTIPYYVCVEWKDQCTDDNAGNSTAQSSCEAVQCATMTVSDIVSTSSSSSAAASSTGSSSSAATTSGASATSASASAASSTATGGAAAVGVAREYGAGVLVASLFGLFAYAL